VPEQRESADLVLVHTSDVHVGADVSAREEPQPKTYAYLRAAVDAAAQADVLLIAGDLFDHNRLRLNVLEAAVALLAGASCRIVILPGNHDPLTPDSVYFRGPFAEAPNVSVLGLSTALADCATGDEDPGRGESVVFPEWDLEFLGRAHRDYGDMAPLGELPPRTTRWRVVLAHGHYEDELLGASAWRPSWRFRNEHLVGIDADYVALGHWNRAVRVGDGGVPAYYSGSPDLARTVNVVRLASDGTVNVTQEQLRTGL
jgi:DNA repair exonuclease SbcCD nuclease subunit